MEVKQKSERNLYLNLDSQISFSAGQTLKNFFFPVCSSNGFQIKMEFLKKKGGFYMSQNPSYKNVCIVEIDQIYSTDEH